MSRGGHAAIKSIRNEVCSHAPTSGRRGCSLKSPRVTKIWFYPYYSTAERSNYLFVRATNWFTDCDDKGITPTASGKLTSNSSGDKIICFYFHDAALITTVVIKYEYFSRIWEKNLNVSKLVYVHDRPHDTVVTVRRDKISL